MKKLFSQLWSDSYTMKIKRKKEKKLFKLMILCNKQHYKVWRLVLQSEFYSFYTPWNLFILEIKPDLQVEVKLIHSEAYSPDSLFWLFPLSPVPACCTKATEASIT